MIIVGAGMAGLLAANMLRHRNPVVEEMQDSLPNNHHAVLRFRTTLVSDVLGIPFRRVRMVRHVLPWLNPVADALAYSKKVTGQLRSDRSVLDGDASADRYVAPPDLISRMAERVVVRYGVRHAFPKGEEKVISTIPMPSLMAALSYRPRPDFVSREGWVIRALVRDSDAFVSVVVPNPAILFYRASVTGNELIVEGIGELEGDEETKEAIDRAVSLLGLSARDVGEAELYRMPYAKILPISEAERRDFIYWASTVQGRAFSLGRFACWRPGLLLDDLVSDVRKIDGWIGSATPAWDMQDHDQRVRRV